MQNYKDFTLCDENNKNITLSNVLKNHNVYLFFYRGKWWGVWAKQFLEVSKEYNELKEKYNAEILGICVDSIEDNKEFHNKLNLQFPLLSDEDRKVIKAYDVSDTAVVNGKTISLAASVIINKQGEIKFFYKGNYKSRPNTSEIIEVLKEL